MPGMDFCGKAEGPERSKFPWVWNKVTAGDSIYALNLATLLDLSRKQAACIREGKNAFS